MAAHRCKVKVRFYELDPYGHLNHSVFVQYFETARIELLEEAGLDLESLDQRGCRFVVNRIETSFLRSVHAGDVVEVRTDVLEMRRASSRWRQRMYKGDQLVANQIVRAAICDSAGKPTRTPEYLANGLTSYFA